MDNSTIVLIVLVILILLLAIISLFVFFSSASTNSSTSPSVVSPIIVPNATVITNNTVAGSTLSNSNNFLVDCPQALAQIAQCQALGALSPPTVPRAVVVTTNKNILIPYPITQCPPQLMNKNMKKNVKKCAAIRTCNMTTGVDLLPANTPTIVKTTPTVVKTTPTVVKTVPTVVKTVTPSTVTYGTNSVHTTPTTVKEPIITIGDYKINDQLYSELLRNDNLQLKHKGKYIDVCDIGKYQLYLTRELLTLRQGNHIIHEQSNNKLSLSRIWTFAQHIWALDKDNKILKLISNYKNSNWKWDRSHQFTKIYSSISCSHNKKFLYVQYNSDKAEYIYSYSIYNADYKTITLVKQGYSNDTLIYGKDEHHYLLLQEDMSHIKVYIDDLLSYQVDDIYKALLDNNNELIIINKEYSHKYNDLRILHDSIYYLLK